MDTLVAPCVRCTQPISIEAVQSEIAAVRCGHCNAEQMQVIYPAAYRDACDLVIAPAVDDGATCYFHESSDAQNLCDDCGRYLCELCTLAIPMPANSPPDFPKRLCPACFENRVNHEVKHQRWDLFRTRYPRYDVVAGFLILGPVILFPFLVFSIFTLPMGLFVLLRSWRFNRTPVQQFRGNMIAALIAGILGIAIWLAILGMSIMETFQPWS